MDVLSRTPRKVLAGRCLQVLLAGLLAICTVSCDGDRAGQKPEARRKGLQVVTIDNTAPRRDVDGQIIDAHDGCLQLFGSRFYLYGTAYGTNAGYSTANRFRVYGSPDLQEWTFCGELLKEPPPGVYYRPYVVFNRKTRKYVLWYNWYYKQWEGKTGVAISDTPVGPFSIVNTNVALSRSQPGDGSLFVDDDGTGYFIYTAIDRGYTIRIERLTPDYLGVTGEVSDEICFGSEAPVLFRRNNLYYAVCGPRCAFCPEGSEDMVFISYSPLGPYGKAPTLNRRPESGGPNVWKHGTLALDVPGGKFALASTNKLIYQNNAPIIPAQQTYIAKIPTAAGPAFIWMADRWQSAPDGVKGHDLQYWSPPLKFDPDDGTILPIENAAHWDITWSWGD